MKSKFLIGNRDPSRFTIHEILLFYLHSPVSLHSPGISPAEIASMRGLGKFQISV